jgi:magnesium transporter
VADAAVWIDLLDPSPDQLREHLPSPFPARPLEVMLAPASGNVRPSAQGYDAFVFALLVAPVAVPAEDRVYYQEIALVVARDQVLTVRKTPARGAPYDPAYVREVCEARATVPPAIVAYHVFDDVAERYLDLVDTLDGEVDELEEHVDDWTSEAVRRRLTDLRHDLLTIRRTLAPTRDTVRGIVDGRVDVPRAGILRREVFPRELESRSRRFTTSSSARRREWSSRATSSAPCVTTTSRRSRWSRTR